MDWPLGVAYIVYKDTTVEEAAELAKQDGFEHIDALRDSPSRLAVALGDCYSPHPTTGYTTGALPVGEGSWDKTVEDFRRAPGARLEPWPGGVVGDDESLRAILAELPGLELTVDVGHVTAWGGDPLEYLEDAAHVQLRQAKPGATQALDGDVDFAAILKRLEAVDYVGLLTVEYFDLPERGDGWGLEDPRAAALETAREVRALLG
jgi:sugar phosphate isomerase/epimerase